MDRFVGRSEELSQLEDLYSRGISTCAVYGRRRVGKTALLQRFCRDKRHIFLTVPTKNREVSLKALSVRMSEFAGEPVPEPGDIHDIIGFLSSIDGDERTVIVIDEFPNLADFFPDTPSAIQTYVDHRLKDQNAMLIVCGSSIGAMTVSMPYCIWTPLPSQKSEILRSTGGRPPASPLRGKLPYR